MAFEPFLAYSASAGSGKTYTLTVRYVALLFLDQSPASILTATFTNKAAAEMRERIVEALRNFGEDRVFLQKVAQETGLSQEALLQKKEEIYRRFLRTPNYIMTMDAFFALILRSAAFDIGLEPDFETNEMRDEALEADFLDETYRASLLESLVRLSIEIEDKRFRKLFDMFDELYRLDPLLPQDTYTLSSKADTEARIDALRREMLSRLEALKASKSAISAFQESNIETFVKKPLFAKASLADHAHYKKPLRGDASLEGLFGELKAAIAAWYRLKEGAILYYLFLLYEHYKHSVVRYAKRRKTLTFDDVSYFTYRLLHHGISRDYLYFKLDTRFKHILLDEFQDTSTLQFLMLQPLIDEMFAGKGQSEFRSFFYVGDTKQSLYRFRGGVEALFDEVARRYGMKVAHLDTNYRSAKAVVETVNRLFASKMEGFVPQKCRPDAPEGYVEVLESDDIIQGAITQARRFIDAGIAPSRIAFLVHTNKEGAQLQEACEAAGIPTVLQTRSTLRYVPRVAALVEAIRYLKHTNALHIEALCRMSGKKLEEVDLSWYKASMPPLAVLDGLIKTFGVFEGEGNVLRLLEFAARFDDVDTFLEEFEQARIDVASHSLHGARIMTVHGSKGLEFDAVVVLDRTGRQTPDTSPLLYAYDERLHIDRIFYRMAGRDRVDEAYAEVTAAQKEAAQKDRLNVLYVALTRAAEVMTVIKSPEASVFDVLDLTPMSQGSLAHLTPKSSEKQYATIPMPTVRSYGRQEVYAKRETAYDIEAVRFGTALHFALEMLDDMTKEALERAVEATRNRFGCYLSFDEIDAVRRRIGYMLEDPAVVKMFRTATVHKEAGYIENGEFRRIDVLLEYEDCAYVIDYKSAYRDDSAYKDQVRAYVKAAERFLNKPTGGALLFLEENGIRWEEVVSLNKT